MNLRVKSVRHWFSREHPEVHNVHFVCGPIVNQSKINPYKGELIVVYKKDDYLDHVLGFIQYGSDTMVSEIPRLTIEPVGWHPVGQTASMDEIRAYIQEFPKHGNNPVIDLMLLSVGRFEWHTVPTIPLELLEMVGIPVPPVCEDVPLIDWQTHWPRRPTPCKWFEVNLSDVPNELARRLVLYPGGKVHVADTDVWQVVVKTIPYPELSDQLTFVCDMAHTTRRRKKLRRKHVNVISSEEEAKQLMAPCMRQILEKKRFPMDHDRQYLVRTMARGGVELSVVGEILDELNAKYPHADGAINTQRRWDYVAHYKRDYSPPSCEKMQCPLAPGEPMDVKKSQCFKLFTETFPDKHPYTRGFYGPIKWYEW